MDEFKFITIINPFPEKYYYLYIYFFYLLYNLVKE